MQETQGNMDDLLSRNDLRDDEEAKRYFQLQNGYLAFKEQLNTKTRPLIIRNKKFGVRPYKYSVPFKSLCILLFLSLVFNKDF